MPVCGLGNATCFVNRSFFFFSNRDGCFAFNLQREFWKIVHSRESYVSVHRGRLDTNQEHSCFSTDKGDPYSK